MTEKLWKSTRGRGGTGRRKGLKIPRWQRRVGSSPTARTTLRPDGLRVAQPRRVAASYSQASRASGAKHARPGVTLQQIRVFEMRRLEMLSNTIFGVAM